MKVLGFRGLGFDNLGSSASDFGFSEQEKEDGMVAEEPMEVQLLVF